MMKWNFGQETLTLPADVLDAAGSAGTEELRVLLWLSSDLSLADKPRQLAKLADVTETAAKKAVAFWQKAGVLTLGDAVPAKAEQQTPSEEEQPTTKKPLRRADELPNYSSTELSDLLERREGTRVLVDEAQRTFGKIFNVAEVNVLIGMNDYLGMSEESILLLLAHCKRIGKTGLRAVERYAISLSDEGVTDPAVLESHLLRIEELHTFEGEIRTLFGLNSRTLTEKERKMLSAWMSYGYGVEIVRRAYELTVNATGKPSIPYTNSILERWHSQNLQTAEEIDRDIAESRNKASGGEFGNSFNTDDFFESALKRSFPG